MSKLIHTPGPCRRHRNGAEIAVGKEIIALCCSTEANGRLLAAAYNAFDSAARKLGCNAVEMAERMQGGGIADLVVAFESLRRSGAFLGVADNESLHPVTETVPGRYSRGTMPPSPKQGGQHHDN